MIEINHRICLHCGFVEAYEVQVSGGSDGQQYPKPVTPEKCSFCKHAKAIGVEIPRVVVDFNTPLERARDRYDRRKRAEAEWAAEKAAREAKAKGCKKCNGTGKVKVPVPPWSHSPDTDCICQKKTLTKATA
jgi:ribosomal protein L32